MFEERDYETLMEKALAQVPTGLDANEGSIIYDSFAGALFVISEILDEFATLYNSMRLSSCEDDFLDAWGDIINFIRNLDGPAEYKFIFSGVDNIDDNTIFVVDGNEFYVKNGNDETYPRLVAVENNDSLNNLSPGTIAVPENDITNLISAEIGEIIVYGRTIEEDESYYDRMERKLSTPERNNNSDQVRAWAESVSGVYKAVTGKAINGKNQIYGFSAAFEEINDDIKEKLQEYLDPGATGLGRGVADLGCCLEVSSFDFRICDIVLTVKLKESYSLGAVKSEITNIINTFLEDAFISAIDNDEKIYISKNRIISEVFKCSSVKDVTNIEISSDTLPLQALEGYLIEGYCFKLSDLNIVES